MTNQEKALFFEQLAALLHSGASAAQSLQLLAAENRSAFSKYLQQAGTAMQAGQTLSAALAANLSYFDGWTLGLLQLAEYSGSLATACQQLAARIRTQQQQEKLYRSIEFWAIASLWCLLLLIVAIFKLNTNAFARPMFWLYAAGLGALLWVGNQWWRRYWWQGKGLSFLPGAAQLIQARAMLDLAQMALPLSCGASVLASLDLTRQHLLDPANASVLASASRQIRAGRTLSYSLQGKIPAIALQMITVGEETGNLDAALQRVGQYYQQELERSLLTWKAILRPLNLIAFGSLIAIFAIWLLKFLFNSLPD